MRNLTVASPGSLILRSPMQRASDAKKSWTTGEASTPEVRRYNEIKGGVITGSIGIALGIFLNVFMQGLILSGKIPPDVAEILGRLWVVGVIPLFVGIALIVNGVFVSKTLAEIARQAALNEPKVLEKDTNPPSLRSADTTEFVSFGFSVTEGTTKHLGSADYKQ